MVSRLSVHLSGAEECIFVMYWQDEKKPPAAVNFIPMLRVPAHQTRISYACLECLTHCYHEGKQLSL